ncbi:MAG: hypothetical protein EXS36_06265 [Pedosphaera sp.]|nr:hypothetical protein [Pedosphaera sp.]
MSLNVSTIPTSDSTDDSTPRRYVLQDRLTQYSLPNSHHDPLRKVTWTNTLCACVLAAGLLGVQKPVQVLMHRTSEEPTLIPIEEIQPTPPPTRQAFQPAEQSPTDDSDTQPPEPPPVAPSVAPITANSNFVIPVEGPVNIVKEILNAAPPPRNPTPANAVVGSPKAAPPARPSGLAKFNSGSFKGDFPDMEFDDFSKEFRSRNRGKALSARIQWNLTPEGMVTNFVVLKASGTPEFEREVIRWMKRKYRFDPPGQPFILFQDIEQSD